MNEKPKDGIASFPSLTARIKDKMRDMGKAKLSEFTMFRQIYLGFENARPFSGIKRGTSR